MKLRTIADFASHSTNSPLCRFGQAGGHASRRILYALAHAVLVGAPRRDFKPPQVPVRAFRAVGARAPSATARFTAEITASREAVMMFECIPAPNSVRRERVVISM